MLVFIISSYILLKDYFEYQESNRSNEELIINVFSKDNYEDEEKINWSKLESINKDIVGWIEIENTNINYPILKDDMSLRYLKHTYDNKYNASGSIFTLASNPFEDEETVIYGHNMKNGSMFSDLGKYMNKKFFEEHREFYIYTKTTNYKATIFSCYSIGLSEEENNIKTMNFNERINYYKKTSIYSSDDFEDFKKIIKLSTCSYIGKRTTPTDQRYYIVAKLEKTN